MQVLFIWKGGRHNETFSNYSLLQCGAIRTNVIVETENSNRKPD